MVKIDRIIVWIFIFGFICLIPNKSYVVYSDELCYLFLLMLGIIDCVVNNKWREYRLMWIIIGAMVFYAIYSLTFVRFNSFGAILSDAVIEMKSFVSFAVIFAAAPRFTSSEKFILKWVAIANVVVATVVMLAGNEVISLVMQHPYIGGTTIFISAMVYVLVMTDGEGNLSRKDMAVVVIMFACGLICGRSKYFGETVVALYFLLVYKPGFLKTLTVGHMTVIAMVLLLVLAVSWQKFDYYFISGNVDATRFDPDVVESFARPVLYLTGGLIMVEYIPFGSGLASFATNASISPYSGVYHEYGIDKVYGLSEAMPDFICDAYYPVLAQFGIVGLVLFIYLWVYAYSFLRALIRNNPDKYRYEYVVGTPIIIFLLIESIGGNTLAQGPGVASMMLLGYVCAIGKSVKKDQSKGMLQLKTKRYI